MGCLPELMGESRNWQQRPHRPFPRLQKKRGHREMPPLFFEPLSDLLDRDFALHAKGKVRRAEEGVLASLDVGERDGDRLPGVHLQRA